MTALLEDAPHRRALTEDLRLRRGLTAAWEAGGAVVHFRKHKRAGAECGLPTFLAGAPNGVVDEDQLAGDRARAGRRTRTPGLLSSACCCACGSLSKRSRMLCQASLPRSSSTASTFAMCIALASNHLVR